MTHASYSQSRGIENTQLSLLYALFKAIRSKLKSIIYNKKETVKTLARIGM